MERTGGVTAHVSPFAGVNDAGALLGRAGEALAKNPFSFSFPPSFFVSGHVNALLGRAGFSLIKVFFFFGKRPLVFALTERRRLRVEGSPWKLSGHAIDVSACYRCVLMLYMCPDTSRALLYMCADRGWACMRAGFSLPAVDVDTITYYFPDALTLMHVLQGMGGGEGLRETAALLRQYLHFCTSKAVKQLGGGCASASPLCNVIHIVILLITKKHVGARDLIKTNY